MVGEVEGTLKEKKWDTTATVKYLKEQTAIVETSSKLTQEMWVEAVSWARNNKSSATAETLTERTTFFNNESERIVQMYKTFAKETLSEFTKGK